ncbi:hypothetical protein G9A89_015549 [Geosiphon pyriformis]|nr:hypothetical protein G9A89_015549 [Geosiphon pyriformis]
MIKKTHQLGGGRKAIKKKEKERKKTNLKPIKPPKPAPVAGENPIQPTPDQSHCIFLSNMHTHYYCKPCHHERYGYPKCQDKWDNELCLACGGTCDALCQYTILISDWVSHGTPITAAWHQQMANAKVEDALPSEILEIKNNSPEPMDIALVLNPDTFLDLENSPEEFYEHYQNLAPTREKQEQCLKEINT